MKYVTISPKEANNFMVLRSTACQENKKHRLHDHRSGFKFWLFCCQDLCYFLIRLRYLNISYWHHCGCKHKIQYGNQNNRQCPAIGVYPGSFENQCIYIYSLRIMTSMKIPTLAYDNGYYYYYYYHYYQLLLLHMYVCIPWHRCGDQNTTFWHLSSPTFIFFLALNLSGQS